jgi:hypothetical protein
MLVEAVEEMHGPVYPFVETIEFLADEETNARLLASSQNAVIQEFMSAIGQTEGPLVETRRGVWGDLRWYGFSRVLSKTWPPSPGWTGIGGCDGMPRGQGGEP